MHFFFAFNLAIFLPCLLAAPLSTSNTTSVTANTGAILGEYYLVTSVIGPGNINKSGLYVSGYHTGTPCSLRCLPPVIHNTNNMAGAGLNDVTLGPIDVASKGFLNGTYQQFDYNTTFPWGLDMGSDGNYAGVFLTPL